MDPKVKQAVAAAWAAVRGSAGVFAHSSFVALELAVEAAIEAAETEYMALRGQLAAVEQACGIKSGPEPAKEG